MKLIFLFLVVSIFMTKAMAQPVVENTKPFVLGVVDEIDSKILAEKRVMPGVDHATIAHQAVFNAMRHLFANSK